METRVVKNVCAPAVLIGDQIIIVGGKGSVSPSLLPPLAQLLQDFAGFLLGVLLQKERGAWEGKEECVRPLYTSHGVLWPRKWGQFLHKASLTPSSRT